MAGVLGDIAEPKQVFLAERRIIPPLGGRLPAVLRPNDHVVHRASRPVAIEHFQGQPLRQKRLLDAFQRQSHLPLDHAFGRLITGERPADEIIRSGIADVLDDGWINVAQIDKTAGQGLRPRRAGELHRH
jgi:hypothetical protein